MLSLRWRALVSLSLLSLLVCCKVTAETKDEKARTNERPRVLDTKVAVCTSFEGGKLSAVWSDCPDKVRREIKCAMFIDDLKCDCLEDGAQKWFFSAKDPPLLTRVDATRVANNNCHWSLESP